MIEICFVRTVKKWNICRQLCMEHSTSCISYKHSTIIKTTLESYNRRSSNQCNCGVINYNRDVLIRLATVLTTFCTCIMWASTNGTFLLCKRKHHCTADLFDWFGFDQTCKSLSNSTKAKQLNPNRSNRRSAK